MQPILHHPDDYQISSLSDRAVLVSFGNVINEGIHQRVLALHQTLQQSAFAGFIESVPAYASLGVFYDAIKVKAIAEIAPEKFVADYLQQLIGKLTTVQPALPGVIKIPVCYDALFAPDIETLAALHRLSIPEVIHLHSSITYRVYMIGFLPGFAYMGTVDERLVTPRKTAPRPNVPAGSVGIAGAQTGIYPLDSPGGWQIIGRTPIPLFDRYRQQPSLLSPGDQVQFFAINQNEFDAYVR